MDDKHVADKLRKEIDRVFPKVKVDDAITFGKYKGKNYREVFNVDPQYIEWFVRNNDRLDLDLDSFRSLWGKWLFLSCLIAYTQQESVIIVSL